MSATLYRHARAGADVSERWAGVGSSRATDSFEAGAAAAAAAQEEGSAASLYIVFAGHRHDSAWLLAGVDSVVPDDAHVIGCTTGGEIGVGGPHDDGVVVMALGGRGLSISTRSAAVADSGLRTAGAFVAGAVDDVEDLGHTIVLLLSDGLAGDQQEVVRGAYAAVGAAVPLVGGCAGDGMEMHETTLFHGTASGSGMVVGAAISSAAPMGIGVHHGWLTVGEPTLITSSTDNVVHTIDEQPALDRYLAIHDAPADVADSAESFTRWAATHPMGIVRRGREEVRFISGADLETRSITSIAALPEGALAWAMCGTAESVLHATDIACGSALEQLDGPPIAVLAFDCVARRGVIGDDVLPAEVDRIAERAGAPIIGFYTYGEFARVQGASGFHNQTLVTLAIG